MEDAIRHANGSWSTVLNCDVIPTRVSEVVDRAWSL
jgi:hypothetical protein